MKLPFQINLLIVYMFLLYADGFPDQNKMFDIGKIVYENVHLFTIFASGNKKIFMMNKKNRT